MLNWNKIHYIIISHYYKFMRCSYYFGFELLNHIWFCQNIEFISANPLFYFVKYHYLLFLTFRNFFLNHLFLCLTLWKKLYIYSVKIKLRQMNQLTLSSQIKLSLMMLFQYMLFAVWWVPLAAYLTIMDISATQKALILSSMAIGCLASPIIGMLADRHFSGQKVLAVLNFLTSILLLLAGFTSNPVLLFIFLLGAMLCHMPTWGLTSSIAMTHAPSELFPRIRVFGSIGWVVSGVFSFIVVRFFNSDFDGTNIPFFFGAGISLVAALFNLGLPKTPPLLKGTKASLIDAFGLRTLQLMKDRNFAIFIVLSFLAMIPFSIYFSYFSEFLLDKEFKYISISINLGPLAEMFFLLTIPFAIKKVGLRNTMGIGLVFLLVRYLSFYFGGAMDAAWLFFIGIMVHGLIFGYFYVGGQIYIDKKAPAEFRSQAQGFIFLVTFGLGMLIGNLLNGMLIDSFSNIVNGVKTYDWDSIWGITSASSFLLLIAFFLLFKSEKALSNIKN
jgi:nucleoside transporter